MSAIGMNMNAPLNAACCNRSGDGSAESVVARHVLFSKREALGKKPRVSNDGTAVIGKGGKRNHPKSSEGKNSAKISKTPLIYIRPGTSSAHKFNHVQSPVREYILGKKSNETSSESIRKKSEAIQVLDELSLSIDKLLDIHYDILRVMLAVDKESLY